LPTLASAAFQLLFGWLTRPDVHVDCRTDAVVAREVDSYTRQLASCQETSARHTCVCSPCSGTAPGACPACKEAAQCPSCWGSSFFWRIFFLSGVFVGFSGFGAVGIIYRIFQRGFLKAGEPDPAGRRVAGIGRPARLAVSDGA